MIVTFLSSSWFRWFGMLALSWLFASCKEAQDPNPEPSQAYASVNPYIGSAPSNIHNVFAGTQPVENEGKGQTFPATGVPHGMHNWTPQTRNTEEKCISPYYYPDSLFTGIRASHFVSGSCVQDYGSMSLMPLRGENPAWQPAERGQPLDHDRETAEPAYYALDLPEAGLKVEMSALNRSSLIRVTFGPGGQRWLVLEPNSDEGEGYIRYDAARQEVHISNPVHRIYQGWGKSAGFSGHYVVQVEQAPVDRQFFRGNERQAGVNEIRGKGEAVALLLRWPEAQEAVQIRIGGSFTSVEAARENLVAEIPHWELAQVRAEAQAAWEAALAGVKIKGAEPALKQIFYTSLYHMLLLPRTFSDVSGTYPRFAGQGEIEQMEKGTYYADYTAWDTYRCLHPLLNLFDPPKSGEMMQSLILKAEQGGWMPIFPCWNHYTAAMIGDHTGAILGDAAVKGVPGFDLARAWPYLRKNAFESPADRQEYIDGKGRRALSSYLKYGYIPLEDSVPDAFHQREQVSRTLEYAYNDFVLAQIAQKLGEATDYQTLIQRAANYHHVFDAESGWVRGRYADGRWIAPFAPGQKVDFITEGSPAQYSWYVPQDIPGLVTLMGGEEAFVAQLDSFFARDWYWHGNEPGHQTAYLYALAGAPWKTQQAVRNILAREYGTGPGGLNGNDDAGQLSAWAVASMLGFYPVTPGTPYYILGSPVFEEASIRVGENRYFTVVANHQSWENAFIQTATLNGQPFQRVYLTHEELVAGGELVLEMGPEPNPA
jgi:predicted alpha-1,2-mannosidase